MNTRTISLAAFVAFTMSPCCRPKAAEKSVPVVETDSKGKKTTAQADLETSIAPSPNSSQTGADKISTGTESNRVSYEKLEKDLEDALAKIPPPRTMEEYDARRVRYREMLDHRRDLLFSIPVSPNAEKARNEAWNKLDLKRHSGYFDKEQRDYIESLMKNYYDAPQLEKLVMWELVRCRMDYWKSNNTGRGGLGEIGSSELLLRREMAMLLFAALEIDAKELFAAVELKRMLSDDASERKRASEADEKIEEIYTEQSKVAEEILEKHWKLPP